MYTKDSYKNSSKPNCGLFDRDVAGDNRGAALKGGSGTTRVGRWMSQEEYAKMVETGKVQMSPNGNTSYVANPADINAFGSQAKPGSIYVEFDVDSLKIYQAGNDGWGQIPGPGSLYDRLNIKKGLPPIEDMPNAYNIKIGGEK
ncbi:MAG: hypothetical protein E7213_04020 [Clostridium sp.]|nr:hypothetical protein [Clostridium sp.]